MWEIPSLSNLRQSIQDPNLPIGMRMRAAYYLKQHYSNSMEEAEEEETEKESSSEKIVRETTRQEIIQLLTEGLQMPDHGSLLRHEFAYVLGQIRDVTACPSLERVLSNPNDCVMVRHECAEALGAIGAEASRSMLQHIQSSDAPPELRDTCLLALNVMDWRLRGQNEKEDFPVGCACMLNPYQSVDPAPPHPSHSTKSPQELGDILVDASQPMFERYRAMFSLRNLGGEACTLQLCRGLQEDTSSPLLRHEVAYVLGQLQHAASMPALVASLQRVDEHVMVRHESAEALGAIDSCWEEIEPILKAYSLDSNRTVAESCLVALDAADYWGHAAMTTEANGEDEEEEKQVDAQTLSFVHQKNHVDINFTQQHFNVIS